MVRSGASTPTVSAPSRASSASLSNPQAAAQTQAPSSVTAPLASFSRSKSTCCAALGEGSEAVGDCIPLSSSEPSPSTVDSVALEDMEGEIFRLANLEPVVQAGALCVTMGLGTFPLPRRCAAFNASTHALACASVSAFSLILRSDVCMMIGYSTQFGASLSRLVDRLRCIDKLDPNGTLALSFGLVAPKMLLKEIGEDEPLSLSE
mmetsp:Transcript_4681/g.11373  ORF Transcript_4681/g.11373 Transcript_4681/m.11373 type:complete len:206 (+) Transcript_4681:850-1467(+)